MWHTRSIMQIQAPFEAYRGDKPYLFISYAHKDSATVYPILKNLQKRGWRMWFDEGIDPGNEWTAFIEKALTGCGQVLSFISVNSVESLNCRQEINLAIDDKKPVLAVHLEETELKYGLRLRMSAFQAVMKYRIESDDEFFRALDRGLLQTCREGGPEADAAVAASETTIDAASSSDRASSKKSPPLTVKIAGGALLAVVIAVACFALFNGKTGDEPQAATAQAATDQQAAQAPVTETSAATAQVPANDAKVASAPASDPAPAAKPKQAIPKGFAKIESGSFMMGSPASEALSDDNEMLHKVSLGEYWIGQREVTQAEWNAVMDFNPSTFKGDTLPVDNASWYEVIAYCNKRSLKEGLVPCYSVNGKTDPKKWGAIPSANDAVWNMAECDFAANGYRLPTEAEWEYACRADTRTAFFTGANITTDQANYDGSKPYNGAAAGESRKKTLPVGSFKANEYGLFDMSGNVWEWCNDWYGPYAAGTDPAGPADGATKIVRGGSWDTGAQFLRSGVRGGNAPHNKGNDLGFRLAFRR